MKEPTGFTKFFTQTNRIQAALGFLTVAIASAAMVWPQAVLAGSAPVPVPPSTPTPSPGRARPTGDQIQANQVLPSSAEELMPLSTMTSTASSTTNPTTSSTIAPTNNTAPVSVPLSVPLSRSAVSNLRAGVM